MDPNNNPNNNNQINQPLDANPIGQPSVPPQQTAQPSAVPAQPFSAQPPVPPKNNKKILILTILLILTIAGMAAYVLFAKNQLEEKQNIPLENRSVVIPTPTLAPTLAPEQDLEVIDPEADLAEIEKDLQEL